MKQHDEGQCPHYSHTMRTGERYHTARCAHLGTRSVEESRDRYDGWSMLYYVDRTNPADIECRGPVTTEQERDALWHELTTRLASGDPPETYQERLTREQMSAFPEPRQPRLFVA